jgi:Clp amino terminal domain, pathogenicity island component/UvrB/uvrC motif
MAASIGQPTAGAPGVSSTRKRLRSEATPCRDKAKQRRIGTPQRGYAGRIFEKFTERARQVVVLAQDEARACRHNYIGTEHLLLGLLRDPETVAARVLSSLDVSLAEVRGQVALIVGEGDELTTGQIPFTPRAKKVLELSLRESQRLGDNHIDTEHLLLGLVRENEGVAARILLDFGVDADTIRERVVGVGSGTWTPPPKPKPYRPASPPLSAEVGDELERLRDNMEAAIEAQEFGRAAKLRERERLLTRLAGELEAVWEGRSPAAEQSLPSHPTAVATRTGRSGVPGRRLPLGTADYATVRSPSLAPTVWFALGALVLGAGLLLGWLIWA